MQRLLQESNYTNQLGAGHVGNRSCRQEAPTASIINILTATLCFFFTTFFTHYARAEVFEVFTLATFFAGTVRLFLVTALTNPTDACTHHVLALITNFIHNVSQPLKTILTEHVIILSLIYNGQLKVTNALIFGNT